MQSIRKEREVYPPLNALPNIKLDYNSNNTSQIMKNNLEEQSKFSNKNKNETNFTSLNSEFGKSFMSLSPNIKVKEDIENPRKKLIAPFTQSMPGPLNINQIPSLDNENEVN